VTAIRVIVAIAGDVTSVLSAGKRRQNPVRAPVGLSRQLASTGAAAMVTLTTGLGWHRADGWSGSAADPGEVSELSVLVKENAIAWAGSVTGEVGDCSTENFVRSFARRYRGLAGVNARFVKGDWAGSLRRPEVTISRWAYERTGAGCQTRGKAGAGVPAGQR